MERKLLAEVASGPRSCEVGKSLFDVSVLLYLPEHAVAPGTNNAANRAGLVVMVDCGHAHRVAAERAEVILRFENRLVLLEFQAMYGPHVGRLEA